MSSIFAIMVRSPDSGVLSDNRLLVQRSAVRGSDAVGLSGFNTGELKTIRRGSAERLIRYPGFDTNLGYRGAEFVGCCFSMPALSDSRRITKDIVPPFTSGDARWIVTVDGSIPLSGNDLANKISANGFDETIRDLSGQFAILALNRLLPGSVYWATKAKPLYALYDALGRCVRVASQSEFLSEFYHPVRSPIPVPLGPYKYGLVSREGIVTEVGSLTVKNTGSVVLYGGGLDSLVASWSNQLDFASEPAVLLYVDYGCKAHLREWTSTQAMAREMQKEFAGADITAVKITTDFFKKYTGQNALMPGGPKIAKTLQRGSPVEWVPARNTVLISMALSYAEAADLGRIIIGANGDTSYPDSEQEYVKRWNQLSPYTLNSGIVDIVAPLAGMNRTEVVALGKEIKVPWSVYNWSCFEGGKQQCGRCSSCRLRQAAFRRAGMVDPTTYAKPVTDKDETPEEVA